MPEGDAVFKDARALRTRLHDPITLECRWPRVVAGVGGLLRITTVGKHLLLHFDTAVIRVHRRMTGHWRHFDSHRFPREDLTLALLTTTTASVLYRAPVCERIDPRSLETHVVLSELGPDVLDARFDAASVVPRIPPGTTAGEALLNQRIACGIGNVYRAEALFFERVSPFVDVTSLAEPARLWNRASKLMRANLAPGRGMQTRQDGPPDHWVYGRARRRCLRCTSRVSATDLGQPARTVYWCERCQPRPTMAGA